METFPRGRESETTLPPARSGADPLAGRQAGRHSAESRLEAQQLQQAARVKPYTMHTRLYSKWGITLVYQIGLHLFAKGQLD